MASLLRELGYASAADASTVNWVISHPEIELMVAIDPSDKPIGLLTLSHRPQLRLRGRIGMIEELIVAEGWRRKGVGRALLNMAVERSRSLAVKRLELATHPGGGEGARTFCEACGFVAADVSVFRHRELDFQR